MDVPLYQFYRALVPRNIPKVWDIEAPKTLTIWSPAKQQFLDTVGLFGWGGSFVGIFESLVCWDGIWIGIFKRRLSFFFSGLEKKL